MKNRSNSGAALTFVAAATVIFMMITFAFFVLSLQIGGSRELLHATDAGSLTVAREAIRKPDVPLTPQTEEQLNFAGLLDKGQVSLANYNRIVGQTLLVALNAQAEDSLEAKQHADLLVDVLQGSNGIASRLSDALNNKDTMGNTFTSVALVESVRMLGNSAQAKSNNAEYQTSYMEPGASSNVDLNPATLPFDANGARIGLPKGATTGDKSKNKFNYISGYAAISFPGMTKSLSGVPVMPGQAPHLVSQKDFNKHMQAPAGVGTVPPNSFKNGGQADVMKGIACSIVGALGTQFTASIPQGYIIIHNGPETGAPAASFDGILGGDDQIFAKELNDGIYVGPGSGSNRAFTTNKALYEQWLDYNTKKAAGQNPGPEPSRVGIFGAPETITATAFKIDYNQYGNVPTPEAVAMLPAFTAAYPHANEGVHYNSDSLMAVELFKAQVGAGFHKVSRVHDVTDPNYRQYIPAPGIVTGLKAFNHGQVYAGQPSFGRTGSLRELLTQCSADNALQQIEQRMHQIKPDATDAEIQGVLNSASLGVGETVYLYMQNNKLTISANKPSWAIESNPDGHSQASSSTYDLINKSVDAPHDGGAPVFPFMETPPSVGIDSCVFTPSSGYRNLLGVVNFTNQTQGGGMFADPN